MAEQEIQELKDKLEAQLQQFQNYKAECKQLQEFLEEESNKKEDEIRKLKEESIKKEKNYSLLKAQVGQLEAENNNLKDQLKQFQGKGTQASHISQQLQKLNQKHGETIAELEKVKGEANSAKQLYEQKIKGLTSENQGLKSEGDNEKSAIAQLQKQIQRLKAEHKNVVPKVQKVGVSVGSHSQKHSEQKKALESRIATLQKKLQDAHHHSQKSEEANQKLSKLVKQHKYKTQMLTSQKEQLLKKLKQMSLQNSPKKEDPLEVHEEEEEEHFTDNKDHNSISALIMTKKHYVSPFLQLKDNNVIKLYKSTKNGCFQKSLGATKYKLNEISYDSDELLSGCANSIQENMMNGVPCCSVVLYGPKKSTKKYLMANLLIKLKDFLIERARSTEDIFAEFIKGSADPDKKMEIQANTFEEVQQVIDKVISMAHKSQKKHEIKKKGPSKPKARIFRITLGEQRLEIITSSFTNIAVRDTMTITEALNNLCYARLPNSLQPMDCHRQIILTVNPIVSLYEDCKNTLAISNCKKNSYQQHNSHNHHWEDSPIKQDLNNQAKKKFESIERESEQYSLRVRKLEEEVGFYRSRFDQLQVRLKTLMNTHQPQNSYLKKSPVLLSYEKMLKFVHSVLARNTQSSFNATMSLSKVHEDFSHTMNIEEGYGSSEEIL